MGTLPIKYSNNSFFMKRGDLFIHGPGFKSQIGFYVNKDDSLYVKDYARITGPAAGNSKFTHGIVVQGNAKFEQLDSNFQLDGHVHIRVGGTDLDYDDVRYGATDLDYAAVCQPIGDV